MNDRSKPSRIENAIAVVRISLLSVGLLLLFPGLAREQVICPSTNNPYTAFIENQPGEARAGEPFFIMVRIAPDTLPPACFVSTLVDVLQSPDGSNTAVVTGFPKIRLTMDQPGAYRIIVRVSLVSKSSCGGVEAEEILRKAVDMQVSPSSSAQ